MIRYKNLSGNSGVHSFENGVNSIKVQFKDGSVYLYDVRSTGLHNILTMQSLATIGRGLNRFISTTVRKKYASKIR